MENPADKLPSPEEAAASWQEQLRQELHRSVPSAWRERLLEELTDHLSDLKEEAGMETFAHEARLGSPQEIAAAAAAEYRQLGFFARRPLLTYLVGPLVVVPVTAFAVVFLGCFVFGMALEALFWLMGVEPPLESSAVVANAQVQFLAFGFRFLPFAPLAWFFCRLAHRHGRGWTSAMLACGVIAVYALLFTVTLTAETAEQQGMLMIGLSLPFPTHWFNYLQAAAPLAVGFSFLWSAARAKRQFPGTGPQLAAADSES